MKDKIREHILRMTKKYTNQRFFLKDWANYFNVTMKVIYEVCDELLEEGYIEEYCQASIA